MGAGRGWGGMGDRCHWITGTRRHWRVKYSWTPLFRTRLSRTPRYLELLFAPLSSNQPRLSRTSLHSEETLVKFSQEVQSKHLVTRCTESWEMYWRVTVIKVKSDWLDLPLRIVQRATSCRYLLILGIKLLLQKFDANLAISNPRYLELFLDTLESSR